MGCGLPSIHLYKNPGFTRLWPVISWTDGNCRYSTLNQRTLRWQFYKNGHLLYQTPYDVPTAMLHIGMGSTYVNLLATPADISEYLISIGYSLQTTDILSVRVQARNCNHLTQVSNVIRIPVVISESTCPCAYATAFSTGQTGTTATLPGGFTPTAGLLAFRNGILNSAGTNFTVDPLLAGDELMFATLGGCTATLLYWIVNTQTGNVSIPPGFTTLMPSHYMVFRNGVLQYDNMATGGFLIPMDPSVPSDVWTFVAITGSAEGCYFGASLIGLTASGSTLALPAGYTATNQNKWLLVRNGVVLYPGSASAFGYSVAGSTVTLVTAAASELFWIVPII